MGQRTRRTHEAIDTKLSRKAPTKGPAKQGHDSHDEQTGAKNDEQTETCRNGTTTKTIRHDTIGALRSGYHDNDARGTTSKTNLRANETHTDRRIRKQRYGKHRLITRGRMKNAIRKTNDAVPTRNNAHELRTTRIKNYAPHAYHDRTRHV